MTGSHVLVVIDGSTRTLESLEYALVKDGTSEITVLYVIDPLEANHQGPLPPLLGYWGNWYVDDMARAEATMATARGRADAARIPIHTLVKQGRTPSVTLSVASSQDVDQIVIDGGDRSPLSRLTGSTAQRIARRAPTPVTVV